jgi:hypothetical protein
MKNWDIVKGMGAYWWMTEESHALVLWGGSGGKNMDANSIIRRWRNREEKTRCVLKEVMQICDWEPDIAEENRCENIEKRNCILVIAPKRNQSFDGVIELVDSSFNFFMKHGHEEGKSKWYLWFNEINGMGQVVGNLKEIIMQDERFLLRKPQINRSW